MAPHTVSALFSLIHLNIESGEMRLIYEYGILLWLASTQHFLRKIYQIARQKQKFFFEAM